MVLLSNRLWLIGLWRLFLGLFVRSEKDSVSDYEYPEDSVIDFNTSDKKKECSMRLLVLETRAFYPPTLLMEVKVNTEVLPIPGTMVFFEYNGEKIAVEVVGFSSDLKVEKGEEGVFSNTTILAMKRDVDKYLKDFIKFEDLGEDVHKQADILKRQHELMNPISKMNVTPAMAAKLAKNLKINPGDEKKVHELINPGDEKKVIDFPEVEMVVPVGNVPGQPETIEPAPQKDLPAQEKINNDIPEPIDPQKSK